MTTPPKIDNAPGLKWKLRRSGWEARWEARADLVRRGYAVKSRRIWSADFPSQPTPLEAADIQDKCHSLQSEMLVWGRGGLPEVGAFDGTLKGLIRCYQTDKDSPFRKKRYHTRLYYETLCRQLEKDFGDQTVAEIKARQVLHWHEGYTDAGKVAMGHSVVKMLRILMGFGATILEDAECERLSGVLSKMRFTMPKPRTERLTAEQAIAIRAAAHKMGRPSIALAQAFQFELMLRQKDVIGEWVPVSEPGMSEVLDGNNKWLRGLRWEEIDVAMVLTHVTSKRQKEITVDLRLAQMVIEELATADRTRLPATGPIVICEHTGVPWEATLFRRAWREAANAAGIPKTVRNMDSRAGAISEATDAGADLEHVRHAATHSDIGMTQRYSRGSTEKVAGVMQQRAEFRKNRSGT